MKSPEMYLECVACGKTYDPWGIRVTGEYTRTAGSVH